MRTNLQRDVIYSVYDLTIQITYAYRHFILFLLLLPADGKNYNRFNDIMIDIFWFAFHRLMAA